MPVLPTKYPGFVTHAVGPNTRRVLTGQLWHAVLPTMLKRPAVHVPHTVSPAALENVPAAQDAHVLDSSCELNVPAKQVAHATAGLPVNDPAPQPMHVAAYIAPI